MMTSRNPLSVLAMAAVLAGCGTTVKDAAGPAGSRADLGPAQVQAPTAPTGQTGVPLGQQAESPGTAGPSTGGTTGGSVALPASSAVPAGVTGRDGPGVTATTLTIGVLYSENAAAANSALGAGNLHTSDPAASTRALVADINAHGGVAGRKLDIITYGVDPQSPQPYASSAQAVCSYFTEDHKVFAMLDGMPATGQLARSCLDKRGVLYLGGSMLMNDDFVPGELDVLTLTWRHLFQVLPAVLAKQGWFGGWDYATAAAGALPVRVGILTVDRPQLSAVVDHVLVPALRAEGHAPAAADIIRIAPPGGFSDDGAVVAAIHGAVLRFRADGVTHVILTDANGSMSLLFQDDTFSQRYFPRLGGSSGNGWQALLTAGSMQAKTLAGAMGIGWAPLLDLAYDPKGGAYPTAARRACFAVFAKAGQSPSDANTASSTAAACDVAYLLPRALRGYVGPITRSVALRLVAQLGASYPTAGTLGLRFAPDRRDGIGAYSAMAFQPGCGCMAYVGPRTTL